MKQAQFSSWVANPYPPSLNENKPSFYRRRHRQLQVTLNHFSRIRLAERWTLHHLQHDNTTIILQQDRTHQNAAALFASSYSESWTREGCMRKPRQTAQKKRILIGHPLQPIRALTIIEITTPAAQNINVWVKSPMTKPTTHPTACQYVAKAASSRREGQLGHVLR